MSTLLFDWSVAEPKEEPSEIHHDESVSDNAVRARLDLASTYAVICEVLVPFPNASGKTFQQLLDFYEARGTSDRFLYQAQKAELSTVTGGALGTGDGSTRIFKFSEGTDLHKYIHHTDFGEAATTLVVKVDGVVQTLGGGYDYVVTNNGTDPTITFNVGSEPGNTLAITVDYRFYLPVQFDAPPTNPFVRSDLTIVRSLVKFSEWKAGGRLAA